MRFFFINRLIQLTVQRNTMCVVKPEAGNGAGVGRYGWGCFSRKRASKGK